MGKLGRSRRFSEQTRRIGLYLMTFGGLLSLACNVYAGANLGQRLYGVLLVVGFLIVETFAGRLAPAPAVQPTVSERRSTAARKAAATRKANATTKPQAKSDRSAAARKAAATRAANKAAKLELEHEALVTGDLATDAPTSPIPYL